MIELLKEKLSKFPMIVIWGYRDSFHSHKFIHEAYFKLFSEMGLNVYWVDNIYENNNFILKNSLIMIPDVHLVKSDGEVKHVFSQDFYYILHPGDFLSPEQIESIDFSKVVKLYEYRSAYKSKISEDKSIEKDPFVWLDYDSRTVLQPWGTNLEADDFLSPVFNEYSKDIYFVGSVWGDDDGVKHGNKKIIENLDKSISSRDMRLIIKNKVTIQENIDFVRFGRFSVSPGAIGHNKYEYLQCRTFKNISYGQLVITDVLPFKKILGNSFVDFSCWDEAIDKVLSLSKSDYTGMVLSQQSHIKRYTYKNMWMNMIGFFD